MSDHTAEQFAEARDLIWQLCEDLLPPEGADRLEQFMRAHREIRTLYFELVQLHAALLQRGGSFLLHQPESPAGEESPNLSDAMILPALHLPRTEMELASEAPAAAASTGKRPKQKPRSSHSTTTGKPRLVRWLGAAAVLLAIGLAAALLLHRSWSFPATIADSFDARFDTDNLSASVGTRLAAEHKEKLSQGLVQLALAGGARVLVEAPAEFSIDSDNAMSLDSGSISAVAEGPAHGFKVITPTATVVDLGTEFGVKVSDSRATNVQVFRGSVVAFPRSPGSGEPLPGETLSAGESVKVASGVVTREAGGASAQAFVRTLAQVTSPIDVVDLVAGGDGTTHRRTGQIDPRNGRVGEFGSVTSPEQPDADYHPIPSLSVFDGCFVPYKNTQVDSDGHHYFFSNTGRFSFYYIAATGSVGWEMKTEPFKGELSDVDYSQPPHGFILMHSNCGLTLDLTALRRLHPGLTLRHFTAVVGNTFRKLETPTPKLSPKADAYVLVDGMPRFVRMKFVPDNGAIPIDVPVRDSDRFLTLVITDGGDGGAFDWVIFGDPMLQ